MWQLFRGMHVDSSATESQRERQAFQVFTPLNEVGIFVSIHLEFIIMIFPPYHRFEFQKIKPLLASYQSLAAELRDFPRLAVIYRRCSVCD